ncbi:MAG: lipopolysaccharide heptosyltransferase II [Candidatus Omnitrophica bacterium]|nr:lipopolysaccharide heptosyltransferase II [Candidatus Omnitrophota bacterium]
MIRLDRIGDVVLSTPVLAQLRAAYPQAFIAMMVRPACREVVDGHPAVNEVIFYEKEGAHRHPWASIRFALGLRRHRFDTALVLHPSNRSHWIPFLAGIPRRIGWRRKSGWLLTHALPHRKQEGERHEADYTLELLRPLGLAPQPPAAQVPVSPRAQEAVERLLAEAGVATHRRLVAIHPSASCVSKRWLADRFAQVADRLIAEQEALVCLIAGPDDAPHAKAVAQLMRRPVVNLAGRLGLGELAALLRRCALLISNDSGPVHIAAAVGTPVVDIFGRNQRGLSPARWGPLGPGHVVLHKEVGCVTCLAHECDINFLCLTELSAEEVYHAAVTVLSRPRN